MPKLKSLTNNILKELLRSYELDTAGNKTEMCTKLMEYLGSDEISDTVLQEIVPSRNNNVQAQIDALKITVESFMQNLTAAVNNRESERAASVSVLPENSVQTVTANEDRQAQYRPSEVMSILPEFDPKKGTLSTKQFIDKIESLRLVYRWSDEVLLFATQGKLLGHAKAWADAHNVFESWADFSNALIADFPCETTMADEHLVLANTRQSKGEKAEDYYYRVLARGRRVQMDEKSIIRHIINGLVDDYVKRTCNAMDFTSCVDLLKALNNMTTNVQTSHSNITQVYKDKRFNKLENKENFVKRENSPICFNCGEQGHISKNCLQPPRRSRCTRCDKVHRRGQLSCDQTVVRRIEACEKVRNIFERQVTVAGKVCTAYIDTGSECHLIKWSCANYLQVPIVPCSVDLSGLWGGMCMARKKIEAELEIDELKCKVTFFVVNDDVISTDLLLGRSLFEKRGVIIQITSQGINFSVQPNVMKTIIEPTSKIIDREQFITDDAKVKNVELHKLIDEYPSVFSNGLDNIGEASIIEMNIELTSNDVVAQKPYRVPEPKKNVVRKMISEMLQYGIIEESTSDYASPIILVKKKNGTDRLCVDYRMLNKITRREIFPTPNIEELLQQAKKFKYYTSLDMNSGYYQIPIASTSRKYTAFVTVDGLYQFKRMPFGLTNAPAVFQRLMAKICEQLPQGYIINYMDDILIGSNTEIEMLEKLRCVFDVLQKNNLTLNISKCTFMSDKIQFLGHQLTAEGLKPGEIKTKAIKNYPQPTNVFEIRRFLGLSGYFRKFFAGYAIIAEPLRRLLKKDQTFMWGERQTEAFNELKRILTSEPVLTGYKVDAEHELHTDASSFGLASVLMQREEGVLKPVAYYSRSTTENEAKFHSYELEVLAVVEGLERFRVYVYGKPIKVITDCNAVTTLMTQKNILPRIARWWLKVQDYYVQLEHRAGQRMLHVDALSRAPCEEPREVDESSMKIAKVNIDNEDWLYTMQMQDEKLKTIFLKWQQKDRDTLKHYKIENWRLFKLMGR